MAAVCAGLGASVEAEGHRRQLIQNAYQHPAAMSPQAARLRYIPTNTFAFREYVLDASLAQANQVNEMWQLGLPSPIMADHVTRLAATPMMHGISGGITISNRFQFGFNDGAFTGYHDTLYRWQSIERDFPRIEEMAKQRNQLTLQEAGQIAAQALRELGIAPSEFDLRDAPVIEQRYHVTKDDLRLSLPLYLVSWKPSPSAQFGGIRMEVSGLSKKVVCYENPLAPARPLPTNYFQMLGISPDRSTWGKQFGYDPRHTAAFDQFARSLVATQANRLVKAWKLDFSRELTTSDITWFLAEPRTNMPAISGGFTNRFYLQMLEGYVDLFEDKAHSRSSFAADESKLNTASVMTNTLDEKSAIQLARESLHAVGLDERELRLHEPPMVKQVDISTDKPGQAVKLPLYDVFWYFPPDQQPKFGDRPAIGVQLSAATKRIAMFANNCPWTPKLSLPTNYFRLFETP